MVVALSKIPATPSSAGNGVSRQISTKRGQYQLGNETTWFGSQAASGGILPGIGSHSIDAILWWLEDEPARISAEVRSLNPAMDIEDEAAVLMTTRAGVLVSMEFSFNYPAGYDWAVAGDGGVLRLRGNELTLNDQPVAIPEHVPLPGEATLHGEFLAAISESRAPAQASGRETLRSIAAIDAAQRAAKTGAVVAV